MTSKLLKELFYCVGAFICMVGTFVLINLYMDKVSEVNYLREEYKSVYEISRQIEKVDGLYIDEYGNLRLE